MTNERPIMHYGKKDVFVYRTYAKPLIVDAIPESDFTKRENTLFGIDVQVALHGDFLKNYTEGDNSNLIATDSMRNFVEQHAAKLEFSTIDGFLTEVANRFLQKYPQIHKVEMAGQQVNFGEVSITKYGATEGSGIIFRPLKTERARANVTVERSGSGTKIVQFTSGLQDIHMMKITGNSFYGFVQDEYTQLPEKKDRNLFIYVDMDWTYNNPEDGAVLVPAHYVAAEQVRDIAAGVFYDLKNNSIQHLVYHIGLKVLERFPQLKDVSFYTNNRTWKEVAEAEQGNGTVYTEPTLPYGFQAFTVVRDDLKRK